MFFLFLIFSNFNSNEILWYLCIVIDLIIDSRIDPSNLIMQLAPHYKVMPSIIHRGTTFSLTKSKKYVLMISSIMRTHIKEQMDGWTTIFNLFFTQVFPFLFPPRWITFQVTFFNHLPWVNMFRYLVWVESRSYWQCVNVSIWHVDGCVDNWTCEVVIQLSEDTRYVILSIIISLPWSWGTKITTLHLHYAILTHYISKWFHLWNLGT